MSSNSEATGVRVAVDIGGTFTDFQIVDEETGKIYQFKTSTTPEDPSKGLVDGLLSAARLCGFDLGAVRLLMHGTTIATNAVLERRFPNCALITTAGFEDVLEIGRHIRRDVYGLYAEERTVLLPRTHRFGVRERIGAQGQINVPLDEDDARRVARAVAEAGVRSVAICLLNSFSNGAHEKRVREIIASVAPQVDVSVSIETSPEIREYPRTSTTVLNALLVPTVRGYLEHLDTALINAGIEAPTLLIQSNGGVCTPAVAARQPARLLLSGPCGGAIAAEHIARTLGIPNLVAVDMGGTSFDVSLVRDNHVALVAEGEIDGCPVRLPMVEMRTIGAGGGSIARVDDTGRLRVGPKSAGAMPGPACYGRGGTEPTVTDANLVLGRIGSANFLGGTMQLDREAASRAIVNAVARPLNISVEAAAEGIIAIVNANMANAIRLSLFEKGLDPTDFALLAFGGAGGLHAAALAEEIGIRRIVFPHGASTLSAFGMLWTDIVHQTSRSLVTPADEGSLASLSALEKELVSEADAMLASDGVEMASREISVAADMRYFGQGYELTVPWAGKRVDGNSLDATRQRFHEAHDRQFLHSDPDGKVEIVTLRAIGRGRLSSVQNRSKITATSQNTPTDMRRLQYAGAVHDFRVWSRNAVHVGAELSGPAIVEESYTTIVLPPGWRGGLREAGHLVSTRH